VKTKGLQTLDQQTLDQQTLGKDAPAASANGWIVVIMPPTFIAPSSMAVTDRRAGSFARPSEAARVLHLLHDSHKQAFSLRILAYSDVREPHAVRQSSPTPIFDGFEVNPFVMTFETEGKKNVARSLRLAIGKTAPTLGF